MFLRKLFLVAFSIGSIAAVGLTQPPSVAGQTPAAKPSRDQRIADIEKQIRDLQQKLEEIKRAGATPTVPDGVLNPEWVKAFHWRCIGPAAMGGRITALSVFEADPTTYWVATASGGLLKTTNNGITFEHQFDREATVSVGDVCVAPSDRNIVWVGTGENNPRNSVSYGDGVYKSTDGGRTWQSMGLKKSYQIGKIIVHPKDPNIVYVGALGRLWGPNEERGLFKTTDGGKTWQKVLYVDDKTGLIDMRMHPTDPETLIAATWERQRDGYDSHRGDPPVVDGYDAYDPIKKWGPGSGFHKTTDGGKTFKKLTKGLPTCPIGRVGLDWYVKDPNVVFAVIDCEKIGGGTTPPPPAFLGVSGEEAENGVRLTQVLPNTPAASAGLKPGDIVIAAGMTKIEEFFDLTEVLRGKKGGDQLVFKVRRDKTTVDVTVTLANPRVGPQGPGAERFALAALLGAQVRDVQGGVRVGPLFPRGPAVQAGLQDGDVIKTVEKKPVGNALQLLALLQNKKPGDKLSFTVTRNMQDKDIAFTVADPAAFSRGNPRRPNSGFYSGQLPNVQNHQGPNSFEYGGVYKSTDAGESWTRVNSLNPRPMYFAQVRVDPSDDKHIYVLGIEMYRSKNGGKTFSNDGTAGVVHPDQHALWINPKDGRHMVVGCDGGFYVTYDRMAHWDFLNHMAIGQFYHCAVDSKQPYWVYGGLQDNGTWGGPSHCLRGSGPINEDWISVSGGDGFVCRVDANDPDLVYFEIQDGGMARRNLRTGEFAGIGTRGQEQTRIEAAISSALANITSPLALASQQVPAMIRRLTGQSPHRFNWNTPFILSSHNSQIYYCGGNFVFRSVKKGDGLRVISPEIARTSRGTASALAESPRNPDVLYAGTDDGNLWITRDGGRQWTNVAGKVSLPGPRWVASIEASRFADGRAYVVFDGHRSDDDEPYVYVTEDFGQTWKSLRGNLPTGSTRVLREDIQNPDLLYLGTEFAVFASVDRGGHWTKLNNNLPTVAVHEIAIHPTAGEIVAATHGRSLWVLDITPLRQITRDAINAKAFLYRPNTAVRWRREPSRGSLYGIGHRHFSGENPPSGAQIYYSLNQKASKASIKILDYAGQTIRELPAATDPGLHRIAWDLNRVARGQGGPAPPGTYRVVLTVDGQEFSQPVRIEADPTQPGTIIAPEVEEKEDKE